MKILFVIPNLEYGGAGRQMTLLAAGLPRDRFEVRVCALGRAGPLAEPLRAAGVPVEVLGWHRWIDVAPFVGVRRSVREFHPDVVHVWRPPALRAVCLAGGKFPGRLVVSSPFAYRPCGVRTNRLDRRLLEKADRLVAGGAFEEQLYRNLGLPQEKIVRVPPGVPTDQPPAGTRGLIAKSLGLPESVRFLVCAGPLEADKGFHDAIWAFDILKYLFDDVHLLLAGSGPDRERLECFARVIRAIDRTHFLGPRPDVPALLPAGEVAWVPSQAGGGVHVALEAMAASRPVIAFNLPNLAEIVADGQTGFLVPVGEKVVLARQTRLLLEDAESSRRMGEAGRRRVAENFTAQALVRRFTDLYHDMK